MINCLVIHLQLKALTKTKTVTATSSNGGTAASAAVMKPKQLHLPTSSTANPQATKDAHRSLAQWIQNVTMLHQEVHVDTVLYSRGMPAVEGLMRSWMDEEDEAGTAVTNNENPEGLFLENEVKKFIEKWCMNLTSTSNVNNNDSLMTGSASASSNTGIGFQDWSASLEDMVRAVCLLMDIPVDNNNQAKGKKSRELIESLHVLFSLYLEFKNSQHFGGKVAN